ncbi:MAG: carboxypeptidase regulatory-like domain-containing protein [Thaumarchaeota archaeon]|nr:hypothetical protein [Candidatus Nitrosotalea sp.]MDE1872785.1 carboxypeptidase regulatory-like domain-containing protein [Nitrososphaerota archaeon]
MKPLHLTTIALVLVLSSQLAYATTYGGHLGPITIQMPFMKTNSTGTITIKYVVYYPHNDTFDTTFTVYDGKLQNPEPLTLKDITISAEPKSINLLENNTVTYTLVAKNSIKGVYGIAPISPCGKYPLVVGLNESEIMPSTLFRLSMPIHCGVISSDAPVREIINYDGIILKNVTRTQDQFSPIAQIQLGSNSTDVQCKQGLDLIIKTHDNMPACVKPETAQTLILRGWGTFTVPPIDNTYDQKMNGTLSGNVVLAGGPRPGPQANYEVDVYATDGVTIVGKTLSDDNGNYSIQLLAGNYTIYAPDYPTRQTHFVSVFSGKNTIFNIVYGTGYK